MVSVIIPVYNVLPFLKEALDSVVNQTYKDIEIIIVDDGSTDGSAAVCDEYKKDPRIIVIHQKNQGLSIARNTGLDIAKGDYIAFLDSDDVLLPDMIQTMVEGIIKSNADIAVCGYNTIYSKGNISSRKTKKGNGLTILKEEMLSREEAMKRITDVLRPCAWNKLYKKEIWDCLRFPANRVFEDTWVLPQMLENANRIYLIPKKLILYRKRMGGISSTINEKNIEDKIDARTYLENYIKNFSLEKSNKEEFHDFFEDNVRKLTFCYIELVRLKREDKKIF